jgi:hypothetical protein
MTTDLTASLVIDEYIDFFAECRMLSAMKDISRTPESLKGRLKRRIARKRGDVFLVAGDVVAVTTDQTAPPDLMAPAWE